MRVMRVQAPRWIWSPGWTGTAVPEGMSLPLTWIPLSESRSMTDQVARSAQALRSGKLCPGTLRPGRLLSGVRGAGNSGGIVIVS
jgi:hypothetical protein